MQATLTAPITTTTTGPAQTAIQAAVQSLRAAGSDELATLAQGLHDAEVLLNVASSGIDSVALGREPTKKEQRKWDAADTAAEDATDALRQYPARTLTELAEKARVLAAVRGNDYVDITANEEAVRADLDRLAGTDQGSADDWQSLAARLAAHEAQGAAHIAAEDAADEAGDDYQWPTEHIEEGRYLREALIKSEAPTWAGVGLKAMLLGPYAGPDPHEATTEDGGWKPTGDPRDWRTWMLHLVQTAEKLGDADPASADSLSVFTACFAAETMARRIVSDRNGYRAWGCQAEVVLTIATVVSSISQDVRRLGCDLRPGGPTSPTSEWGRAWHAAHFTDGPEEPAPELSALLKTATDAIAAFEAAPFSDQPGYDPAVDAAFRAALNAVHAYEAQTAGEALAKLAFLDANDANHPDDTARILASIAADLTRWSQGDAEAVAEIRIEERGTGPDLRPQLTALGAIRPQTTDDPKREAA